MTNDKKTILITGVAGLLGSRLADWIIENKPEYKVVGIDDLSGGFEENINPKVDFWQMNLTEHPIENCFFIVCHYLFCKYTKVLLTIQIIFNYLLT